VLITGGSSEKIEQRLVLSDGCGAGRLNRSSAKIGSVYFMVGE